MRVGLALLALFAAAAAAAGQTPDFSGLWKQDNDRCQPRRSGNVTLRIDQRDPGLTVATSIARAAQPPRHALQQYTTDGRISVSTGADGDEFHTAIVWQNASLVFTIEEHEDGRILRSSETWSLMENGTTLRRVRERANGEKQILYYRRTLSEQP